jgi:hypothetical protein
LRDEQDTIGTDRQLVERAIAISVLVPVMKELKFHPPSCTQEYNAGYHVGGMDVLDALDGRNELPAASSCLSSGNHYWFCY